MKRSLAWFLWGKGVIQNRAIKGGSMELSEPWEDQLIKVSD